MIEESLTDSLPFDLTLVDISFQGAHVKGAARQFGIGRAKFMNGAIEIGGAYI